MSIFASFSKLSDDGRLGTIHRLIKDEDFKVLELSEFKNDEGSVKKCSGSGKPHVACHNRSLGMVYFSQNDFYFEWYMRADDGGKCYWFDEDRFIGSSEDGSCFFVPYSKVLEMHRWNSWEELIVPVSEIKILVNALPVGGDNGTEGESMSSRQSGSTRSNDSGGAAAAPFNSIMKGNSQKSNQKQKNVKINPI